MKVLIARTPIGLFAFTEEGEIIAYKIPSSPEEAIKLIKDGISAFGDTLQGYEIEENPDGYRFVRKNFRKIALEIADRSGKDLTTFLNEFGMKYSMVFLSTAISRDKLLIQASNALEDLARIVNIYNERLWEWFSLHYPEGNRKEIVENVTRYGNRKNFPKFISSLGIELTEEDEKMLKSYAFMISKTEEEKRKLERYVASTAKEIMPNFSNLIDPLLATRFLSLAGSLEKLARMPASTIQLLGSEKALFRHLKQQGKSPKFGILFQDGRIQSAPEGKRGKIARIISSKLMQAARIDFYSSRLEEKLKNDLDKELKNV